MSTETFGTAPEEVIAKFSPGVEEGGHLQDSAAQIVFGGQVQPLKALADANRFVADSHCDEGDDGLICCARWCKDGDGHFLVEEIVGRKVGME